MAKILVLDDQAETLQLLKIALDDMGHEVFTYQYAPVAMRHFSEGKPLPDLILLDLMMPGIDGYAFHSYLQQDSETRKIPVIVVTASGKADFAIASKVAGFMKKPIDLEALRQLVDTAIKGAL